MRKRPLLIVEWDDVSSFSGWLELDKVAEECKPFRAKMVGWEISRDKQNLVLATAFDGENECNGRRVIPRGCIRSIRRLE